MRSTVIVVPSEASEVVRKALEGHEGQHPEGEGVASPTDHAPGSVEDAPWDVGMLHSSTPEDEETKHHGEEAKLFETPMNEIILEEPQKRDVLLVHQHDQPRFRLHGKTAPTQRHQLPKDLSFHRVQERGEEVVVNKIKVANDKEALEEDCIARVRAMEQWGLRHVVQEEAAQLLQSEGCQESTAAATEVMTKAVKEIEELERQLVDQQKVQEVKIRSLTKQVEEQVLQTRVIPMEEVRQDLERWKPAFEKEVNSLVGGPVVPVDAKEIQEMKDKGMELEILPMKAIASKKPPDRLKARIVVCGNFSEQPEGENISVGGACAQAIRCVCHTAAMRRWGLGSIDVTGAFLQAPRRPRNKVTLTEPPSVLKEMNLVGKDTKWRVECALYGLQESPSDWASFRTMGLKELQWQDEFDQYSLEETPEKHIWKIKGKKGTMEGAIAVYVDDFLVAMPEERLTAAFQAIKKKWKCSEEELVNAEKPMRFCGYEIKKKARGGFWLSQTGYLADILKKRNITEVEQQPCPKLEPGPDEEEDWRSLKEAQTIVGEVMWMAGRTRPDISFATGAISRMLHRRPRYACTLSQHLLRYLNGTRNAGLDYVEKPEDRETVEGCENIKKGWSTMEVLADVSYGPETEQYRSVQGILVEHNSNTLFWESVRQPMVALSACESELIGYLEGYTAGEGIAGLLTALEFDVSRRLYGDNKAALAVCGNETGGWRTRHLRIRASRLREILQEGNQWSASHLRGTSLAADGLTKPLNGQAFQRFFKMIGMKKECEEQVGRMRKFFKKDQQSPRRERCDHRRLMMALGGIVLSLGQKVLGAMLVSCAQMMRRKDEENATTEQAKAKVRMFKVKEEKDQGEQAAAPKSTARQRGLAALSHQKKDEVTVSVEALSEEFKVTVNVTKNRKGEQQHHGGYGSSCSQSAHEIAGSRCSQSVHEVGGSRSSQSVREVTGGRSSQSLREIAGSSCSQSVHENASESGWSSWTEVTGPAESERRRNPEELYRGLETAEEAKISTPWKLGRYGKQPSSGNDVWDEALMERYGWLVRVHHKSRVRPFHPLHRSTPVQHGQLSSQRITVFFQQGECVKIVEDDWCDPSKSRTTEPVGQWKGYTFFRISKHPQRVAESVNCEDSDNNSFEEIGATE